MRAILTIGYSSFVIEPDERLGIALQLLGEEVEEKYNAKMSRYEYTPKTDRGKVSVQYIGDDQFVCHEPTPPSEPTPVAIEDKPESGSL